MPTLGPKKVSQPKFQKPIQIEKLSQGNLSRDLCLKCGLHSSCRTPFLQPLVPDGYTGKLLLIGDAPYEFERTNSPFSSLGGQTLKNILQEEGYNRSDIAYMPTLRCRPAKTPSMAQIRACAPFVYRAVTLLNAKHVLALGPVASKSLSNSGKSQPIARLRGREKVCTYDGGKFTYYVTSSLSQLGTSPNELARFREDIARLALAVLAYPKTGIPRNNVYLGFDTEYTPEKVLCGAVSDGTHARTVEASQLGKLAPLLSKATIVGHNLPVDLDALIKAKVPGLKFAMEQWLQGRKQRDTLLLAKLVDENRGKGGYTLESLLLAEYNVADYKAPTESLGPDPTLWPVPLRDERCRLDAWATLKVYEAHQDRTRGPEEITHAISMTLYRMRHAGIYVDIHRYRKMKTEVYAEEAAARKKLVRIAAKHGMKTFTAKDAEIRELIYAKLGLEIETRTKGGLPSASVKVLKEFKNEYPEVQAILDLSKADKLKTTYCDGLEAKFQRQPDGRFWLPVYINALAAKTGRRNSAGPNFQNQPVRVRQIFVSRFKGGTIADNDYCVDPKARVLCSDLIWRPAQALVIGQEIIAFPETGSKRKMCKATVTSIKSLTRPTLRLVTDRGSVVVSQEHRWLVKASGKHLYDWKETRNIQPGDYIPFYAEPWEAERSHEAGYLAGLLDGEGWVTGGNVGFAQNPGTVLEEYKAGLLRRGFNVRQYSTNKVQTICTNGPVGEKLRLLGTLRPKRLLPKASKLWEGVQGWGKHSFPAKVLAVQVVSKQGDVIAVGTSTNTLIVEGMFSHNSKLEPIAGGWVTGEHRLTEYFTKYPNGYIKIGKDFFRKDIEPKTKEYTMMKSLVLAILYNKKKWSLADDIWAQGVKLDSNYEKHTDEAGKLLERFLSELFPGVKAYHRRQEDFVLRRGYVDNAVGQRRRLPLPPEPMRSDKFAYKIYMRFKAHVINQAINYPIQSLASYVTGSALIDLERALLRQFKYSYVDFHTALMDKRWPMMPLLCIEVHDDIVMDIPKGMEKKTKEVTHEIMETVPTLRKLLPAFDTPLSVDTNMGATWGVK